MPTRTLTDIAAIAAALAFAPATLANMPAPPRPSTVLVAELGNHGTQVCVDGRTTWTDLFPIAGLVPIVSPPPLVDLTGELVLVAGTIDHEPPVRYVSYQPCEPMQMRDDWASFPHGVGVERREFRPLIPALRARSIKPWRGLSMTLADGTVTVSLENRDINARLSDVRIIGHYEGCMRKPVTDTQAAPPFDLAVGATHRATLPLFRPLPPGASEARLRDPTKAYRLASVMVLGGGGDVTLRIDRSLRKHGIPFACE